MHRFHRTIERSLLASGLALALVGCSDSGGPSDSDLTADLTSDAGAAQADETEQSVAALTLDAAGNISPRRASFAGPAVFRPRFGACATVDNTTDSDGDGAPDEATFTFALPACSFTNFRGGTLEITGTVVVSDPTPTSEDFAYHAALDDFQFHYIGTDATRSYTATRNGTRALTANAGGAALSNTVTTVRSVTGRATVTVSHNTLLTFTPAEGETLARGEPLPTGTMSLSGTLIWSRNGRSRTFTATTVTPLHWDAACTTDRKITAGEIHWTLSNGSYIRMTWTGCGIDPGVEFVPANAG